jgi:HPr kinase/phosphorylase
VSDIYPSPDEVTTGRLYELLGGRLDLESLTGESGFDRQITSPDISRPGLCLAGYTHKFLYQRIQIFGETEITLLNLLDGEGRREAVNRVFQYPIVCSIVTKGLAPPAELLDASVTSGAAMFCSPRDTTPLIHELCDYLDCIFAPVQPVHGTLVDVFGAGLLCTGKSSVGKSEAVLGLVERGHRLVADDMIRVRRTGDRLTGAGDTLTRYHMEIRGLGMVNIADLYGVRATKESMNIDLEVRLVAWSETGEPDRTGLTSDSTSILGVSIPLIILPVLPGRNLSLLLEVAVLNHILDRRGVNPARELNRKLIEKMSGKGTEGNG